MGRIEAALVIATGLLGLAVGCGTGESADPPGSDRVRADAGTGGADVGTRPAVDLRDVAEPADGVAAAEFSHRVVGYFTYWSVYAPDYHVADIPADKLTHINYAFANISAAGECVYGDAYADVEKVYEGDSGDEGSLRGNFNQLAKLKERHPHLKTLISIGGWVWSGRFSDVALTDESRQKFVSSCVDFMQRHGFDGIVVNWEHPVDGGLDSNTTRPEDTQNFTLLVAEFRRQLDALGAADDRHYLLTIDAPPGPGKSGHIELDKVTEDLDWINLTSYDFHGPWSKRTNFNSPLYSSSDDPRNGSGEHDPFTVDAAAQAFVDAGVPAEKIVIGVPFFGRGFKGVPASNHGLFQPHAGVPEGSRGEGIYDWEHISRDYLGAYDRQWHDDAKVPWLYDAREQIMITYDDPDSVALKADYVRQHDLGGVMIWELSADDDKGSLIDALQ